MPLRFEAMTEQPRRDSRIRDLTEAESKLVRQWFMEMPGWSELHDEDRWGWEEALDALPDETLAWRRNWMLVEVFIDVKRWVMQGRKPPRRRDKVDDWMDAVKAKQKGGT